MVVKINKIKWKKEWSSGEGSFMLSLCDLKQGEVLKQALPRLMIQQGRKAPLRFLNL
jgi:hypothetical protein